MWWNRKASSPANVDGSRWIRSLRTRVWSALPTWARTGRGASSSTAPHQNTFPTTAADRITTRSSRESRSSRAPRRAWIDSGTPTWARSEVATQRSPSRSNRPSSSSIRSISSRKSGFPAAGSAIRANASSSRFVPPSRPETSCSLCRASRGSTDSTAAVGTSIAHVGSANEAQQHHRNAAARAAEVLHQVQHGRLRPLQVVQDHQERPVTADPLEEPSDRPEDLLQPGDGGAESGGAGYPLGNERSVGS